MHKRINPNKQKTNNETLAQPSTLRFFLSFFSLPHRPVWQQVRGACYEASRALLETFHDGAVPLVDPVLPFVLADARLDTAAKSDTRSAQEDVRENHKSLR